MIEATSIPGYAKNNFIFIKSARIIQRSDTLPGKKSPRKSRNIIMYFTTV